jgi:hypothetical protein
MNMAYEQLVAATPSNGARRYRRNGNCDWARKRSAPEADRPPQQQPCEIVPILPSK